MLYIKKVIGDRNEICILINGQIKQTCCLFLTNGNGGHIYIRILLAINCCERYVEGLIEYDWHLIGESCKLNSSYGITMEPFFKTIQVMFHN